MPLTTGRLPVWLSHGDRLLVRARDHHARYEADGRAVHRNLATAEFGRASLAYLHGALRDEGTSLPALAGDTTKDVEAAVSTLRGPYRLHAEAAVHAAQEAVINPEARDAHLRFARALAEQLRAGLPDPPPESGGGRGSLDRDRADTFERSR